ncbi:hypothetical protein [Streptomyces sp. NPDC057413]|uniref:hypothetical protein n=1 Tax=Streptomyces sp. NPDC057413 TaxID=3346124 RepID=UPI0036A67E74
MINGLGELILTPMRRRLGQARRTLPCSTGHTAPPVPANLVEGLAQVAAATAEDAAHRAANAAFHIDQGENFLRDERRWRGYEDGEASFYLAPSVVLHYSSTENRYGRDHHFTLLTGDGDQPVTITSLQQIRHHLAARAAGLPLAPAPAASDTHDTDAADDLTALHAI